MRVISCHFIPKIHHREPTIPRATILKEGNLKLRWGYRDEYCIHRPVICTHKLWLTRTHPGYKTGPYTTIAALLLWIGLYPDWVNMDIGTLGSRTRPLSERRTSSRVQKREFVHCGGPGTKEVKHVTQKQV